MRAIFVGAVFGARFIGDAVFVGNFLKKVPHTPQKLSPRGIVDTRQVVRTTHFRPQIAR